MTVRSYSSLAASEDDARLLERRGEEIVGYVIAALLDTFSRGQAIKRVESFGLSRSTGVALVSHIEHDSEIRSDLARRFFGRARVSGIGCILGIGLAFVPAIPKIYVGVIAVGGVYCVLSLLGWARYSRESAR